MAGASVTYRPRILLDIDGVVADFVSTALNFLANDCGLVYRHDDVTTWEIKDALDLSAGHRMALDAYLQTPGTCARMQAYPDVQIEALREFADVVAVTAPFNSETWAHERLCWLYDQFGFEREDVISTHGKHHVAGDYFVDDNVQNVRKWAEANPENVPILFSRPWNENEDWSGARVSNWFELLTLISTTDQVYASLLDQISQDEEESLS